MRELGVSAGLARSSVNTKILADFIEVGGITQYDNTIILGQSYPIAIHNMEKIPAIELRGNEFMVSSQQDVSSETSVKQFYSFNSGGYSFSLGVTITNFAPRFKWYGDTLSLYYMADLGRTSTIYRISTAGGTVWGGTQVIAIFGSSNIVEAVAPVSDSEVFVQHSMGNNYNKYISRYAMSGGVWSLGLTYKYAYQSIPIQKTNHYIYDDAPFEAVNIGGSNYGIFHTVAQQNAIKGNGDFNTGVDSSDLKYLILGMTAIYSSQTILSNDVNDPVYNGIAKVEVVGSSPNNVIALFLSTMFYTWNSTLAIGRKDIYLLTSNGGTLWSAPINVGSNVPTPGRDGSGFWLSAKASTTGRKRTYVSLLSNRVSVESPYTYSNDSNEDISLEIQKNGNL